MQRRIKVGMLDSVEDIKGALNGCKALAFNQDLVGKHLEAIWPKINHDTGAKQLLGWASGRVAHRRRASAWDVLLAGIMLWA